MSATHTGSIVARLTVDGLWQYTGTSHDHAVTGWPEPEQDVRALIPAQRVGNTYEQVVLDADALSDLTDFVPVPSLHQFVADNPDLPQTADHTTAGGER